MDVCSKRRRINAAVDQDILSGDVAGMLEQRKAQVAPNSSAVPKRLAGTLLMRFCRDCSNVMFCLLALPSMFERLPVRVEGAGQNEIDRHI